MFLLRKWSVIRGAKEHVNAGLDVATDFVAIYEPLLMPFDGVCSVGYPLSLGLGQGGKWLEIALPNGDRIECAHLSQRLKLGRIEEGEIIGITGNTGKVTSGPHLHVQIFNRRGNRLDPEQYDWKGVPNEQPLIDRVNEALRTAGSVVEPKRSAYWQGRVANGDKKTFEDLVGGIQFRRVKRLEPHQDGR